MAIPLIKSFDQFNESLIQPIFESGPNVKLLPSATIDDANAICTWEVYVKPENTTDSQPENVNADLIMKTLAADPAFKKWWTESSTSTVNQGNNNIPHYAYMPFMETTEWSRSNFLSSKKVHAKIHFLSFGGADSPLEFTANYKVRGGSQNGKPWPIVYADQIEDAGTPKNELMIWNYKAINSLATPYKIRLADYVDKFKEYGITEQTGGLTNLTPEIWYHITGGETGSTDKSKIGTPSQDAGKTKSDHAPGNNEVPSTTGSTTTTPHAPGNDELKAGATDYTGLKLSNPPTFNKLVKELQLRMQWLGGRTEANINLHGGADGKYGQYTAHAIGVLINGAQGGQDVNEITKEISDKLNSTLAKYPKTEMVKNINGKGTTTIDQESVENDRYFSNKPETQPGTGFDKKDSHGAGAGGTVKSGQAKTTTATQVPTKTQSGTPVPTKTQSSPSTIQTKKGAVNISF